MATMTKYRFQSLLFIFIAFMLGCNEYMIVGVLPDIAHEFHEPLSKLGFLVTMFALIYAASTPIITSLTSRWSYHGILITLMIIFLIGNTWTAFSTNFISLLWSRILTASVAGAIISITLVLANFTAPLDKRASLLSWIFAGFSIASVIGVPIGTLISTTLSWHDSFLIVSIFSTCALLLLIKLSPKEPPKAQMKIKAQFQLFKNRRVLLGILFVIAICAADYTFYTYIRPLITTQMGFDRTQLNWILFSFGICFIIGNKIGGMIADRGGISQLPIIYMTMTVLLLILAPALNFKWLAYAIIAFLCIAVSAYSSTTQIFFLDIATQNYPQSINIASSLNSIFANIGISLGSLTASQIVSVTSVANVGYIGAIYSMIAVIAIVHLNRLSAIEA